MWAFVDGWDLGSARAVIPWIVPFGQAMGAWVDFEFPLVHCLTCKGFRLVGPNPGTLSAGLFPCILLSVGWPVGRFPGAASSLWCVGPFGPFRYFLRVVPGVPKNVRRLI